MPAPRGNDLARTSDIPLGVPIKAGSAPRVVPPERALQCPAPGCEAMVLPSEAASPAGHCAEHGLLFRGRRSGPRQTTCAKGHDLLNAANVYRDGAGQTRCRVCKRARELARERRQAELDARVCAYGLNR